MKMSLSSHDSLKSQVVSLQTAHSWANAGVLLGDARVGVDYKSPITITITITVPIKLSITITITVVIEKAITITITITIIRLRLRLQLLVYHGNDSRLFIRHVHLQYYHA